MKSNKDRLYNDVDFLTKIDPPRNFRNHESLEKAAGYIENEFKKLGCIVEDQFFEVKSYRYRNIIASFNPKKKKRLIVGAHYDVFGESPGADDNASAVAGLLETARMLNEYKVLPNYRIDFVAYCLEEPPFYGSSDMGSSVHAKYLFDNKIKVLGMICYEMIGYFSDEPGSQGYPVKQMADIYPDEGNFIILAGLDKQKKFTEKFTESFKENSDVEAFLIDDPRVEELLALSDHLNYWNYGYNAVMVCDTSFMRNPNYHTENDTIDTLNFDKMAEVVNGCFNAVLNIKK